MRACAESRRVLDTTWWMSVHRSMHFSTHCIASSGDIFPVCQTFVSVPNAGKYEIVIVPFAPLLSSSVGSSQISESVSVPAPITDAEHDVDKARSSMPASASAVLAAVAPAATHPSIPSFSRTVMKMSMEDFGKRSRRMEGRRDWVIRREIGRSSASYDRNTG